MQRRMKFKKVTGLNKFIKKSQDEIKDNRLGVFKSETFLQLNNLNFILLLFRMSTNRMNIAVFKYLTGIYFVQNDRC